MQELVHGINIRRRFALMVEGLSLAGMVESRGHSHRPETGSCHRAPTRTEQGDLLFALYAGHGEFPRVIFARERLKMPFTSAREPLPWPTNTNARVYLTISIF